MPKLQAGNVKLRASLKGDLVSVKELTGTLNGGPFRGGGDFKLGTTGINDANLFLSGKDTFVEYPISVKTISTVDVKLVSRQDGLVLGKRPPRHARPQPAQLGRRPCRPRDDHRQFAATGRPF